MRPILHTPMPWASLVALLVLAASGCGRVRYQSLADAGRDARLDGGSRDAVVARPDAGADGAVDPGTRDGAVDAGTRDGAVDAGTRDGGADAGTPDGAVDPGAPDAGGPVPPSGMVLIDVLSSGVVPFYIDRYEAVVGPGVLGSIDQDQDNDGRLADRRVALAHGWPFDTDGGESATVLTTVVADSRPGVLPTGSLSWYQAAAACTNARKRLCSNLEWILACRGPTDTRYTYGSDVQVPGTCNEARAGVEATGSRPGCTNGFGVFDMNGNVQEWTQWHPPSFVEYRGGAEDEGPSTSRCDYGNASRSDVRPSPDIGFRCCLRAGR